MLIFTGVRAMLGIAVYIAILAYGRVSKSFGWQNWIILLVGAFVSILVSAAMFNIADSNQIAIVTLFQFVIFAVLYGLGVGLALAASLQAPIPERPAFGVFRM